MSGLYGPRHGILHPRESYELLIDRLVELLRVINVDPKRMVFVYDTASKVKITKELWQVEMYTTKDISIALTSPFVLVAFVLLLPNVLIGLVVGIYSSANLQMSDGNSFLLGLFATAVCYGPEYLLFKRYGRRSEEAARRILYPTSA